MNEKTVWILLLLFVLIQGPKKQGPPDDENDTPGPNTPAVVVSVADAWDSLANWIERGHVENTDELIRIARLLRGFDDMPLEDLSRLDQFAPKNETIDDSNRERIAAIVRGDPPK